MKMLPVTSLFAAATMAVGLTVAMPALADGRDHDRGGWRDSGRHDGRGYHGNGYGSYGRNRDTFVLGVDLTPGYYGGNYYGRNYYAPNYYGPGYGTNYGGRYRSYPVGSYTSASQVRYVNASERDDRDVEFDYARVVSVDPITREVRREVPVRECWDETRAVRGYDPRNGTAGGAILGGLLGGAVGNQIGRGDGRRAATVAGAIIGAAVGHDVAEQRRAADGRVPGPREETVERCETRYESQSEQRNDGYRVTYEYQGRTYQTRLPYDPGEKIRVRVAVSPAER
jgi:uncharacterized protein YcfJ